MLIEVDSQAYKKLFPKDSNPFITESFVNLNEGKVDQVVRLVEDVDKPGLGLVAGIKDDVLLSPFSAPFGGFHFRKEIMYIRELDSFLSGLKEYTSSKGLNEFKITFPPDLYHMTFNAKMVNAFVRMGYKMELPDVTNWVPLDKFEERFTQKNSKEYYRQALRNELEFELVELQEEKEAVYNLVKENREKFGRPIFMSLDDVFQTATLWPVDFFRVLSSENEIVASAIIYRNFPGVVYALFWGDNEAGRPLRAMDFLAFNLWSYYKKEGFKYMDLGISTEAGVPNEGLLRFKESHEALSSLKFKFSLKVN